MWELLVIVVRLPVLLLGLGIFTCLGVPFLVGRATLKIVSSCLTFPFVFIWAVFSNEREIISKHFPRAIEYAADDLKGVGDTYNSLFKWGLVQKD